LTEVVGYVQQLQIQKKMTKIRHGTGNTYTGYPDKAAEKLPECREAGNGLKYTIADGIRNAPAAFYFLRPPPLNFQQETQRKTKRSSLETLPETSRIPRAEQIKNIADGIEPGALAGASGEGLRLADEQGVLRECRAVDATF
jgi:hypothetical protein